MLKRLMALVFGLTVVMQSHATVTFDNLCIKQRYKWTWTEPTKASITKYNGTDLYERVSQALDVNLAEITSSFRTIGVKDNDVFIGFTMNNGDVEIFKLNNSPLSDYYDTTAETIDGIPIKVRLPNARGECQ